MTKTKILLTTGILLGLLSSCQESRFRIKSSDHQEINKGTIQQVNKLADYRVETKKVKGTYENQTGYNLSTGKINIETAKEFAIADAIEKSKCDFLVNPLFDIEVVGSFIKVTTEGYPAFYTDFKTVETIIIPATNSTSSSNSLLDFTLPKR